MSDGIERKNCMTRTSEDGVTSNETEIYEETIIGPVWWFEQFDCKSHLQSHEQ